MICQQCKKRPKKSEHKNCKYCENCRVENLKKPKHNLSKEQQKFILNNLGKYNYKELCIIGKFSKSSLGRFCRDKKLSCKKIIYSKEVVQKVLKFYETHNKHETQFQFPNVRVRSIIEHTPHKLKCSKWTQKELIEIIKMAGLVSFKSQSLFLKKKTWKTVDAFIRKRNYGRFSLLNGLPKEKARYFCPASYKNRSYYEILCPSIKVKTLNESKMNKEIFLWCDIINHLKPNCPNAFKQITEAMVKFQCWIWENNNPKELILKMIKEREIISKYI